MGYDIPNVILVGSVNYPLYRFDNRSIVLNSLSGVFAVDVVGNELSVDTFSLMVRYDPTRKNVYAPIDTNGYLLNTPALYALNTLAGRQYMTELNYGTPVFWFCDGSFFTKGYLKSVERVNKFAWKLTVVSGVGLLADSYHVGGIYFRNAVGEVIQDIVNGAMTVDIDEAVATTTINGWLPYDTRRNNLHKLLFAIGASLVRGDENTDYRVVFPHNEVTPATIPASRIDCRGRVKFQLPATAAEITEHSYFETSSDETLTLMDNTGGLPAQQTVIFREPCHDLEVIGSLVIHASGVNYAVVSGVGVLTGKRYTHTTNVITEASGASSTPLVKRVTSNSLVSALNSRNVAKRVLAYFSSAKTVTAKLALINEKCGTQYSFLDAFGDPTTGFLQKMNFGVTSIKAAQCDFVEGYTPTGQGNYYQNRIIVTSSGTVQLPAGVTRIRVVMIGAGSGGSGGYDGEPFNDQNELEAFYDGFRHGYFYKDAKQFPAAGGVPGEPGLSGKILSFDVDVTDGEVLTVSIGAAGVGGAKNGGIGTAGGETTLSSASIPYCSTSDGSIVAGYVDPLTGDVYAAPGLAGVPGGDGGLTDTIDLYGYKGGDGLPGGNAGEQSSGTPGAGKSGSLYVPRWTYRASGGASGGAAYGADGHPGGDADAWYQESGGGVNLYVHGGDGGDGADALPPPTPAYGCGGGAGNGGGAPGNPGGCELNAEGYGNTYEGANGTPGSGSIGGHGGAGALLIYH